MRTAKVIVPWKTGLHLRPAAQLVKIAQQFRSQIRLQFESQMADARSVLGILMLSAGLGAALEIEANGADEREAVQAMREFFERSPGSADRQTCESSQGDNPGSVEG